jgi:L-2,4-diaminobutyrate decarboxylase
MFENHFLTKYPESGVAYHWAVHQAADLLRQALPARPFSGKSPSELESILGAELCARGGTPLEEILPRLKSIIENSINVTHPFTAAHLHSPPLIPALAAEVVLTALNQSMDSFDQAPAATILEQNVIHSLCREAGLPDGADGVFTAGGTQSNTMGLLLARDAYAQKRWGWCVRERGLPPQAGSLRILCSEVAHFSVEKAAAQLGLGTNAVIRVAVDREYRMCPKALQVELEKLRQQGQLPMAIVATAGTTDFGSIDSLTEIAAIAHEDGIWLHVDAAYGGALLFTERLRRLLKGIELADSLTIDFHKLLWQPISCGAFLVRHAAVFAHLQHRADYLNPESHEDQGIPDLVTRSLATTRRFDALKLWLSLQVLGRDQLGSMIEQTLILAQKAYSCILARARFEAIHKPRLGCVVFRYLPRSSEVDANALNEALRKQLFDSGTAVIGRTKVEDKICLKLTCLNPCTSETQITELLQTIATLGESLERRYCSCELASHT